MRYESSDYAEYFGVEQNQNELEHHGIKGQKWGKRNGPPYPLDPEDHSTAEKKASNKSWGIKRSSKENATISRKEYRSILKQGKRDYADFRKERRDALKDLDGYEKKNTEQYYDQLESGMYKSRAVLEKNAGNTKAADKFTQKSNTKLLKSAKPRADDEFIKNVVENIYDHRTGTPKSENVKSLFEEDPSYYNGDDNNFVPKYLKSSKYKALTKQQDDMRKELRVDEKFDALLKNTDESKADKLYKAWDKATTELYSNPRYKAIENERMKMADDFNRQFAIAVLKDLGFATSRENIKEISRLVWL